MHNLPSHTEEELQPMRQLLLNLARERGYQLEASDLSDFKLYTYQDQVDILLEEKIEIISFTFGCLNNETIRRFQENNWILIGTATCIEEALFLREQKIDMISIQGIEAGGHRGTFINGPLPQIGLFSLLPQIAQQVSIPCIAAGGINNGNTMKAAFQLGAAAVQIGTLLSAQTKVKRSHHTN